MLGTTNQANLSFWVGLNFTSLEALNHSTLSSHKGTNPQVLIIMSKSRRLRHHRPSSFHITDWGPAMVELAMMTFLYYDSLTYFYCCVALLFFHPDLGPAIMGRVTTQQYTIAWLLWDVSHKQRHSSEPKLRTRQLFRLCLEPQTKRTSRFE